VKHKFIQIIFKNLVPTSQTLICRYKYRPVLLLRIIIAAHSENFTEHKSRRVSQSENFINIKIGSMYINHCALGKVRVFVFLTN
jgi:hypothetical protein